MKQKFDVTGMTCAACSTYIEKSIRKLPDVQEVSVNLLQNSMQVEYDADKLQDVDIIKTVEKAGYGATLHHVAGKALAENKSTGDNIAENEIKDLKTRLICSFAFLVPLMYLAMGPMVGISVPQIFSGMENTLTMVFTQFLLTLPIIYVNRKYFIVGFKTLLKRAPNMDSLIAIGSSAAVAYGIFAIYNIGYGLGHGNMVLVHQYMMDVYFESAGTILTLITVGKYLEAKSKGKTSDAINKLLDLAPKTAIVLMNGVEQEIPVEEVKKGDIVIVKQGSRVPVDGVIIKGEGTIEESAITGESLPVEKGAGDKVVGATINLSGYFQMEAQKVGEDTTIAQIIKFVEDANSTKAPIAKLADKVSGVFVPVVIVIATSTIAIWLIAGYSVTFALSAGIAVLVISCPCALGLATPTAIMVGTGKGAENGILFKTAESLETVHELDSIVLDKTGTITEGKPSITNIISASGVKESYLLEIAASVESQSEHPLAKAIVTTAKLQDLEIKETKNFLATAGQGVSAQVDLKPVIAGNAFMMKENSVSTTELQSFADEFSSEGKTVLYFAENEKLIGLIAVADTIKPTSKNAIEQLHSMGLEVVMLTGDNERTAKAIQKQLGIEKMVAEVLPQDKEKHIQALQQQGKKVAMVGDGINDAPALARADVGVAIGAGTDIAIESADVVLIKNNLEDVISAIQLSKAVIRNIKQNLFWAFFYNTMGIPVAAGALYPLFAIKLNPMFGAAAMSLSSVFVVTNALRLKFFKPTFAVSSKGSENISIHQNDVFDVNDNKNESEESTMNKTIKIEGMDCMHCVRHVTEALEAIENVSDVNVSLEDNNAIINAAESVTDEMIYAAVADAGYSVTGIE